jgi:putative ABC transport system permease protein
MLARLVAFIRGMARRRAIGAEVDEELRFHVAQEIEAHVARGVPPAEARRMALRDLGGLTATTQAVREVRTIALDLLWRDTVHAVRSLRATPAFTLVALAVLTLSIGAATAIFSVVDGVVLRGLPFDESDRLVAVGERNTRNSSTVALNRASPQSFLEWRDQQDVFTELAAVGYAEISVRWEADTLPENLRAQRVTADFSSVLRTAPLIGRTFGRADEHDGSAPVAIISHGLWQRRFGGRPAVIGTRLQSQRASFEIVGVMPPGFAYPVDTYIVGTREAVDVWLPCVFSSDDRVRSNDMGYELHVVGRLRDGVSIEQAQARMDQITAAIAAQTPQWVMDRATVEPLLPVVTRGVRTWMVMLLAAVSFVLLIACVNLANLMLVRATTRTRELAIRAALGASRWDLSRVLLLESLVLSLTGAALGVAVAWWGVEILRSAIPPEVPRAANIAVDLRVLATTVVAAIVTGLAFGLTPVVQFARPAGAGGLHYGERTATAGSQTRWLRGTLVVLEVALAVVLLVGSGLFLASFARLAAVNLGLDYRDVLAIRVRVAEITPDPQKSAQRNGKLFVNVLERVQAMPDVEAAALLGGILPLRGTPITEDFGISGRELPRRTRIDLNEISADYFDVVKVPVLRGRAFTEADTQHSEPVVILNQTAAARYFAHGDAVGKVVRLAGVRTVVGIVGNIRHVGPEGDWRTQAFVPMAQSPKLGATLVVRTTEGAQDVWAGIRRAIASEFAGLPTRVDEGTLEGYYEELVARRRFNMLLLTLFGLLGLVIAVVGIYGVMAYVVSQRTKEIGIRMALGALPAAILRSILGGALVQVSIGLAIGLLGAWTLAGAIGGFLFEVEPHDPAVYAGVVGVLALAGLTAALVPARRAASVDPLIALRME